MADSKENGVTVPTHVPQRTPAQIQRRAKKNAGRREREWKARQAKRRAGEATQPEAAADAEEGAAPTRARKEHKLVRNEQTSEWAMVQARRWLANERRKLDKGGLTAEGVDDFIKWTRQGYGYDWTPIEQCANANTVISRFLSELREAQQAQKKESGLKDWWTVEPALPRSWRQQWARHEKRTGKDSDDRDGGHGGGSGDDEPGGVLLAMDVDQAEKTLAAGGSQGETRTPEPVSCHALCKSETEDGEDNESILDSMSAELKRLPIAYGDVKVPVEAGGYGSDLDDMAPEPVSRQVSEEADERNFDPDDIAPEPVLRAGSEEEKEVM
ncbi:MAG: hypothetical protein Q9209_004048 [Squamulea sp. 1 TL-2023]